MKKIQFFLLYVYNDYCYKYFLTQKFQNDVPNSYEKIKVTQSFKQICSSRNMVTPQGSLRCFLLVGHGCSLEDMIVLQGNLELFLPRIEGCSMGPTMCLKEQICLKLCVTLTFSYKF